MSLNGTTTQLVTPRPAWTVGCNSTGSIIYFSAFKDNTNAVNTIFKSTDYGVTWTDLNTPVGNDGVLTCDSSGQHVYSSGAWNLCKYSGDSGVTWKTIPTTYPITTIYSATDGMIIVGTNNSTYNVGISLIYPDSSNVSIIYGSTGITSALRTVAISDNVGTVYCYVVQASSVSTGTVNTSTGVITWISQYSLPTVAVYSMACSSNGQSACFAAYTGTIYYTTNYGATWSSVVKSGDLRSTCMAKDGSLTRVSCQQSFNVFTSTATYITIP